MTLSLVAVAVLSTGLHFALRRSIRRARIRAAFLEMAAGAQAMADAFATIGFTVVEFTVRASAFAGVSGGAGSPDEHAVAGSEFVERCWRSIDPEASWPTPCDAPADGDAGLCAAHAVELRQEVPSCAS